MSFERQLRSFKRSHIEILSLSVNTKIRKYCSDFFFQPFKTNPKMIFYVRENISKLNPFPKIVIKLDARIRMKDLKIKKKKIE